MNIEDDDKIIQRCLSGDVDVFKLLVDKYQLRIINTLL